MRLRIVLCIVLPLVILLGGAGVLFYARTISLSLQEPLEQIESCAQRGDFAALSPSVEQLEALWEKHSDLLMLAVDHETIDSISLELGALRAAANTYSAADVCIAAQRLRVHAQHLYRRDLPMPGNIL